MIDVHLKIIPLPSIFRIFQINNEHTQFVGTTIANQPVENLWNNIFVTPLEEHIIKGLHLFDQNIQKVGLALYRTIFL